MNKQNYKSQGKESMFDEHFITEQLSNIGNPLEAISKVIDFEFFRPTLEAKLQNANKKSNAGAKPFDYVTMFKILVLQRYYGLGDKQVEYQILDRTSFKNFLGFKTGDKIPDEKTVWLFRENLTNLGIVEDLFEQFEKYLEDKGLILNEGQIVDASFTVAPRQHNTREENKAIKEGKGDELWQDHPHKKSHKDIDARWTKKNGEKYFGYKNNVKMDNKSKLIKKYEVTDASVHDSQPLKDVLEESDKGQDIYGDSAYTGQKQEETISKYQMNNLVNEKGYRNTPLTEEQKENNRQKSKTRVRIEHAFGFMEQSMNGLFVRSIGIKRAKGIIGLINFTYNLFRYEQLVRIA